MLHGLVLCFAFKNYTQEDSSHEQDTLCGRTACINYFFLLFKIFKRFFLMLNSLALDGKQDNHFANADIQLLCTDTRYLKRFKYSFTSSN